MDISDVLSAVHKIHRLGVQRCFLCWLFAITTTYSLSAEFISISISHFVHYSYAAWIITLNIHVHIQLFLNIILFNWLMLRQLENGKSSDCIRTHFAQVYIYIYKDGFFWWFLFHNNMLIIRKLLHISRFVFFFFSIFVRWIPMLFQLDSISIFFRFHWECS